MQGGGPDRQYCPVLLICAWSHARRGNEWLRTEMSGDRPDVFLLRRCTRPYDIPWWGR